MKNDVSVVSQPQCAQYRQFGVQDEVRSHRMRCVAAPRGAAR